MTEEKILHSVVELCTDEIEIWETDNPVQDGTEQICEGRAEFAHQILRIIRRLEAEVPERKKDYGFDSPEYKAVLQANARRTEISNDVNSAWHPDA